MAVMQEMDQRRQAILPRSPLVERYDMLGWHGKGGGGLLCLQKYSVMNQ